ncbi:hypothetical protein HYH03_006391 [Edaphochlamys debaryana]|uniref:Uncharacterized protein n=1 Tax=Edaphochlamys debaryana TaxID=47281 RepID=A0A836C082_9CHLO|nr:hypothetical protein HYH03_006391 [Edaphochlamys debaryana]|eukprot:KAG2495445.1 hypothetical protein HYH03_006391 [Edaphochlamys debaryana]
MTLSDLLSSNLSRDAHSAIFAVLSSDGRTGLAKARLASRGLRDLVDGAIAHLVVSEPQRGCTIEEVQKLSHGGRWLQRWPQCSRLSLIGRNSAAVLILGASSAPCRRVTVLEVDLPDASQAGLSAHLPDAPSSVAGALAELLRRMSELRALQLSTPAWLAHEGGVPLEGLPHLTSLSLNHAGWLGHIGPTLAPQLTRLKVTLAGGDGEGDDMPSSADLAAALAPMAALQEFVLDGGEAIDYDAEDACVVLDALSPTVQRCSLGLVWWIGSRAPYCGTVACVFSQGVLTSCTLKAGPETYFVDADATLEFLEAILLPCTKLGQRLGLLELDVPLTSRPPGASTAAQLLQRCDAVRACTAVYEYGGTDAAQDEQRSTLALARILGTPFKLNVWSNMMSTLDFNILLRPPPYPDTSSVAMACGRDEGGGSGGSSSGPAAAQQALPMSRAVLEQVLEAMLSGSPGCSGSGGGGGDSGSNSGGSGGAEGGGGDGSDGGGGIWRGGEGYELLLRGPAICTLLQAAKKEQHGWVRTIRERAAQGSLVSYRPLPAVHAIVLTCSSPAAVRAAAEAARQLGAEVGQGADSAGTGPEAGAAGGEGAGSGGGKRQREDPAADTVSAMPAATKFQAALAKVFQALWDGTEPGAPGPDVVGLERLQWLMQALDRVLEPEGLPEHDL